MSVSEAHSSGSSEFEVVDVESLVSNLSRLSLHSDPEEASSGDLSGTFLDSAPTHSTRPLAPSRQHTPPPPSWTTSLGTGPPSRNTRSSTQTTSQSTTASPERTSRSRSARRPNPISTSLSTSVRPELSTASPSGSRLPLDSASISTSGSISAHTDHQGVSTSATATGTVAAPQTASDSSERSVSLPASSASTLQSETAPRFEEE